MTEPAATRLAVPQPPPPDSPAGPALLEQLRGSGKSRPLDDPRLARRLSRLLEEASGQLPDLPADVTIRVTKRHVQRVLACEQHLVASLQEARRATLDMVSGQLLDHLFSLVIARRSIDEDPIGQDPLGAALSAARISSDHGLLSDWESLAVDDQTELRYTVESLASELIRRWPILPSNALVRLQETLRIPLTGGRVVLTGRVDLVLGHPGPRRAGCTLIDLKAGTRRYEDREDAAWYALLETLRHEMMPFQTGNYYLRDGGLTLDVVTSEMLERQAGRVAEAVRRMADLGQGRAPIPTPSDLCPWCPALPGCDTGRKYARARDLEGASPPPQREDDDDDDWY